jgi:hypothetical protein
VTIPANTQAAVSPWGAIPVIACWGTEGGPYHVVDAGTPLPVNVVAGSSGNAAAGATGAAVPADADYSGVNVGGNLVGQSGQTAGGNTGGCVDLNSVAGAAVVTSVAGAPGVGGDTAAGSTDAGNPIKVGAKAQSGTALPAAVTAGQRVNAWFETHGIQIVTPLSNTSPGDGASARAWFSSDAATSGVAAAANYGYNGSTWDRLRSSTGNGLQVDVTRVQASPGGGATPKLLRNLGALTVLKGSAGTLYGLAVTNTIASAQWIQVFDAATAGSVTLGTTTPTLEFEVGASAPNSPLQVFPPPGVAFANGIVLASTTGEMGSTTSGSGVHVNAAYS